MTIDTIPLDVREAFDELSVSRETIEKLQIYERLLREWNPNINLVSKSTLDNSWRRHFLDSLQLSRYIERPSSNIVDLGSGAGFPGMVLAIQWSRPLTLVEVDSKKVAFLRIVSRETQTPVHIKQERIEVLSSLEADVLVSRACAPLDLLMQFADLHLVEGGVCVFLKGKDVENEIDKIKDKYHVNLEQFPSISDCQGVILRIKRM